MIVSSLTNCLRKQMVKKSPLVRNETEVLQHGDFQSHNMESCQWEFVWIWFFIKRLWVEIMQGISFQIIFNHCPSRTGCNLTHATKGKVKQRATNLDTDRRGEWFQIVTRRDICEINASMHIYIRCRRVVMGYRRVVMGYLTALFKVLQGPELNRHGWTGVGRLGKAKLLSAVQTLTLLIRGTWGNRNAVC